MTDDTDNLVWDEESGIFVPSQTPVTGPAESVPIQRREPPCPKALMTDAEAVRRSGWGAGDILEGHDGISGEKIRITAVGEMKVLAVLVATQLKGREWIPADQAQARERMFSMLNRQWKKAEPI